MGWVSPEVLPWAAGGQLKVWSSLQPGVWRSRHCREVLWFWVHARDPVLRFRLVFQKAFYGIVNLSSLFLNGTNALELPWYCQQHQSKAQFASVPLNTSRVPSEKCLIRTHELRGRAEGKCMLCPSWHPLQLRLLSMSSDQRVDLICKSSSFFIISIS